MDSNWQDLRPRDRMEHLLKTGHLSDCSFVVYDDDGEKIVLKCHKFVLMNLSPVFERMFEGDFEESKMPDNIVLDDVSGTDFKKFIEYLYWHDNRRLELYDLPMLQTLIYLSKKFMVSFMTTNCLNVIRRRLANGLDPDVTVDLFEYAHQIEDVQLITCIILKFRQNPKQYVNSTAIFDLSSEIFLKFIEELDFYVSDKVRFDVIDRYCKIHGLGGRLEQPILESTPIPSYNEDNNDTLLNTIKSEDVDTKEQPGVEVEKEAHKTTINIDETEQHGEEENAIVPSEPKIEKQCELDRNKQRENVNKEEYVLKLLKGIKFTSMSPYDFCSGPGSSNLLSVEKKYEILSSICITEHKMRLLNAPKD